ncbi:MAG: DUF3179 domain-containing (seleno)protein, partial [Anaerolineales bacterium]
ILCGIALLPGSLGVMKLTYKFAAKPKGAFVIFKLGLPLYLFGLVLLAVSLFSAFQNGNNQFVALSAGGVFAAVSIFGFFMHVSLMFKPVHKPLHISLEEAIKRFGNEEEVVGVLDSRGKPHAYIARLQRRPHIVYENEVERPFISTHCILAHSSMAYELSGDFSAPKICISSALANNLVFYEKKNNWAVQQVTNATRDGSNRLKALPTVMTSLASWKRLYPESQVWIRPKEWRDTFYLKLLARASVIDPKSPDLVYPLQHEVDTRLPLKAYVNGVSLGGEAKAYPLDLFKHARLIEDTVGNEPIVFLAAADADFVQLYSRKTQSDTPAQFRPAAADQFEDLETGSTWTVAGQCIAGPLQGQRLHPIPHYNKIFWFCWADFFPSTALYQAQPEPSPTETV